MLIKQVGFNQYIAKDIMQLVIIQENKYKLIEEIKYKFYHYYYGDTDFIHQTPYCYRVYKYTEY